jgi:hypothetical protein
LGKSKINVQNIYQEDTQSLVNAGNFDGSGELGRGFKIILEYFKDLEFKMSRSAQGRPLPSKLGENMCEDVEICKNTRNLSIVSPLDPS